MAVNNTAYRYGEATVVIPRRLYDLLIMFAERVRPYLLRGNKENKDLPPHLNAYSSGDAPTGSPMTSFRKSGETSCGLCPWSG